MILLAGIVILYIFFMNFVVPRDFYVTYDIGGEKDSNSPYLSPLARITEPIDESYRNITQNLVYLDAAIPRNSDEITVSVTFKDALPENSVFSIGAQQSSEWNYTYNKVYDKKLNNLINYPYVENSPRVYRINQDKSLTGFNEILEGSSVGTDIDISPPTINQSYNLENLNIQTPLRGSHSFYIYLKDNLKLNVKKTDLNWYEGEDNLTITLKTLEGQIVGEEKILDDGIVIVNKSKAKTQEGNLDISNLTEGTYLLEFSDFDGIIKEFSLNTNKIITKKVFLAGNSLYQLPQNTTTLFINSTGSGSLSLRTYHTQGFQSINLNSEKALLNTTEEAKIVPLSTGEYDLKIPDNDIILESDSFISFSNESFFMPFRYNLIKDSRNLTTLDYFLTNYDPLVEEDGWNTASTKFNIKNLYVSNGKLSLLLNFPHLGNNETAMIQVPISQINIKIHKPGIFEDN